MTPVVPVTTARVLFRLQQKMPSTRSQGRVQPTLAFPRRKSCRVSSHSKTAQPRAPPPTKPTSQTLTCIGPLSPRRPAHQPGPLSPRCHSAPPSSPSPQPRLPLSPRKRTGETFVPGQILGNVSDSFRMMVESRIFLMFTCFFCPGDDNGCNLSTDLLGSPPKQSKPLPASPRRLGFDENSPVSARRRLVPSSPRQQRSPAPKSSPRRQGGPERGSACQSSERKTAACRLFAQSKSSVAPL